MASVNCLVEIVSTSLDDLRSPCLNAQLPSTSPNTSISCSKRVAMFAFFRTAKTKWRRRYIPHSECVFENLVSRHVRRNPTFHRLSLCSRPFPEYQISYGVPAFLRLMRRGRPRQKIDREGKLPSHAILLFVPSSQNDYVKASENLAIGLGVDRR